MAIRERIFSKLRIPDEDHQYYFIYRTEFGEAAHGDPITGSNLMICCAAWADGKGTLKFLVQRNLVFSAVPSSSLVSPQRPSPWSGSDGTLSLDWHRPPWDRILNGYNGNVDGRRQQQPPVIRRFEPPLQTGGTAGATSTRKPAFYTLTSTERLVITATADTEYYLIVEITGASDALAIRERIFSKLGIPEEEHQAYSIYRSGFGETNPIIDQNLTMYSASWSDSEGTLKLLVQRNPAAAPAVSASSFAPPRYLRHSSVPFFPLNARNESNIRSSPQIEGDGTMPSEWDGILDGHYGNVEDRQRQQPRVINFEPPRSIDATTSAAPQPRSKRFSARTSYSNLSPPAPPDIQSPLASNNSGPSSTIVIQNSTTSTLPLSVVSSTVHPTFHPIRRHREHVATAKLESAPEAEARRKEYDAQLRRLKMDRDRETRRQRLLPDGEKIA
ncbi:hypothetical protein FRB94_013663 [Tulasnella sp. JGI-2019a]|nr:hypothetical protein FRB93_006840 [Tulasnella sp. JGI-2019a]KAG8990180.1 hypothetical protein FRB94_013663 [Tulasnella sp. JGI-2019a]